MVDKVGKVVDKVDKVGKVWGRGVLALPGRCAGAMRWGDEGRERVERCPPLVSLVLLQKHLLETVKEYYFLGQSMPT